MKRAKYNIVYFILMVMLVFVITACKNDIIQRTLENIDVTPPTKVEYKLGEVFNPAGMVVTATYSDGVSERIFDYDIDGFDTSSIGDVIVTIGFKDKTADFTIIVGKTLESIVISTLPDKTEYRINENFDHAGMVVTAFYDDDSSVAVTGYEWSGFDNTTAGSKIITVSFGGKSDTFIITVIRTLESINVTSPAKIEYKLGDEFNPSGMAVTAIYDDNFSEPVTNYYVIGFDSSSTGDVTITVVFYGKEDTFTIIVGKTLDNIVISALPDKIEYKIGENFAHTGMEVTAFYDDGSSGAVTGYEWSGFDSTTVGNKIITISFGGKTDVFIITVIRTLERIDVTSMPVKTVYIIGEDFNPAGMIITAIYDDDFSEPVTGYDITGFNSTTAGSLTVTIDYNNKTTDFTLIVQKPESFSITYKQLTDAAPQIEGPSIYLWEQEGKPSWVIMEIENPIQYESNSIKWYINGITINGNSIRIDSKDYPGIGDYFVTVEVRKDGMPYSKTVTFAVAP